MDSEQGCGQGSSTNVLPRFECARWGGYLVCTAVVDLIRCITQMLMCIVTLLVLFKKAMIPYLRPPIFNTIVYLYLYLYLDLEAVFVSVSVSAQLYLLYL